MSELADLYQEVILDHTKHPRNFGKLPDANHSAEGYNPLCGDKVKLYLTVEGGLIKEISFEGSGCAISTASASLLTETLKGRKKEEVDELFSRFHDLVTGKHDVGEPKKLGKLAVFEGVREFPMRVKCATLAWHTLRAALEDKKEPVTTEGE